MANDGYIILNKEIYLVVDDFDTNLKARLTSSIEDLHDHLILLEPEDHPDIKVIHGVITKAKYIPGDMKGQKCFIMILDPGCFIDSLDLECTVMESDSGGDSDVLAEEIEDLMDSSSHLMYIPDIDDVFIIYGYTMEIGLCVNMDSVDEECIDTCERVAVEIVNMEKQEAC
jgi:hypothetical protein